MLPRAHYKFLAQSGNAEARADYYNKKYFCIKQQRFYSLLNQLPFKGRSSRRRILCKSLLT